jgi:hypothetical protein
MPDPKEQDSAHVNDNQLTVDVLRKTFTVATNRLTPEVEPATIYLPYVPVSDSSSSAVKPE